MTHSGNNVVYLLRRASKFAPGRYCWAVPSTGSQPRGAA